jgi:hypothetical protein
MARKKKSQEADTEPVVIKGSHLTVIKYPDGRTKLEWDDEALARDVREAIESYQTEKLKPAAKAKVTTRKTKVKNAK